jgi:hypothetical protein
VAVLEVPTELRAGEEMGTFEVFRQSVGRTFRIEGIDDYGHLELVVAYPPKLATSEDIRSPDKSQGCNSFLF